jgi:hypothetical protein
MHIDRATLPAEKCTFVVDANLAETRLYYNHVSRALYLFLRRFVVVIYLQQRFNVKQ